MAGQGNPDPNLALSWTLRTRLNQACTYSVRPPAEWINVDKRVSVRPQHGRAGFADPVNFAYVPNSGYVGPDRFVIEIDRRIAATGQRVRRVIDFAVTVDP